MMSTVKVLDVVRLRDGRLAADRALEHIRELLATGRLCSGDRVNEVEIAASLGISRGPVREAIRRLSSSGLLIAEPNMGSRVVALDEQAARALYEVREALESLSAGLAARHMTASEKRALTDMLDAHEATMAEQGSSAYPAGSSDWDFHLTVLKGGRNEVAWRICGNDLRDLLTLLRARHGKSKGRGRRALQEHRWIAEAIAHGEADLASTLMAQHVRASRDNLLALMRNPDTPPHQSEIG
jgi:DNA-binding GntR family transcriptional regulator